MSNADDIILLSSSQEDLQVLCTAIDSVSQEFGLLITLDKTKVLMKFICHKGSAKYSPRQWRRFLLNGGWTGVQGQSPPEAEKKLNFDNTKPGQNPFNSSKYDRRPWSKAYSIKNNTQ